MGWVKILSAYMQVRLAGSAHVLMSLYAAAVASVHLALVPLRAVPTAGTAEKLSEDVHYPQYHSYHRRGSGVQGLRFGSENDRWGNERPGVLPVPVWEEHPDAGTVLLERFERLYEVLRQANAGEPGDGGDEGS